MAISSPVAHRRALSLLLAASVTAALLAASAATAAATVAASAARSRRPLPRLLPLAAGSFPEGIAAGPWPSYYVSSLATGTIYRGDFTANGSVCAVTTLPGTVGVAYDASAHVLYVAGGWSGGAYAVELAPATGDASSCRARRVVTLTPPPPPAGGTTRPLINDVIAVPGGGAYFTDSSSTRLWAVPPYPSTTVTALRMRGFPAPAAANGTGANGVVHLPAGGDGGAGSLLVAHFDRSALYAVSLPGGTAVEVALRCALPHGRSCGDAARPGGALMRGADGLLVADVAGGEGGGGRPDPRRPRYVYVVNPLPNTITTVALGPRYDARRPVGAVVAQDTDGALRTPTTVAGAGGWVWAVNSRLAAVLAAGVELATGLADPAFAGWDFDVVRVARLRR